MTVTHYRQLIVWQKAMDYTVSCYQASDRFPKAQTYRLCDQLQRAAVSIPSNIAEGQGRAHTKEFLYHLSCANGSLFESETQILLAERLGYLPVEIAQEMLALAGEIGRMLNGLRTSLQRKLDAGS
jgi:four helix bundle protein